MGLREHLLGGGRWVREGTGPLLSHPGSVIPCGIRQRSEQRQSHSPSGEISPLTSARTCWRCTTSEIIGESCAYAQQNPKSASLIPIPLASDPTCPSNHRPARELCTMEGR